jgi:predicted ATPase with chaperone activity
LTLSALDDASGAESSATVRERVTAARLFRRERASGQCESVVHALEERSLLTRDARSLLRQALVGGGLSGRAYVRIIDLARTIADLDNLLLVGPEHVAEALALRLDHRRVGFV